MIHDPGRGCNRITLDFLFFITNFHISSPLLDLTNHQEKKYARLICTFVEEHLFEPDLSEHDEDVDIEVELEEPTMVSLEGLYIYRSCVSCGVVH